MARPGDIDQFRTIWNMEAQNTVRLLEALPQNQYDFRPDPKGRSIGELAWHLSEIDGYISYGVEKGAVTFQDTPPNLKRPREISQLAPGYQRVHDEAVARLAGLTDDRLDEEIPFVDRRLPLRHVLWGALLSHLIHHRGQLSLLCRLAGGRPPGIYGPNREETEAMRERMQAAKV
jgi:uncharacterized damage-inducible protein DinB